MPPTFDTLPEFRDSRGKRILYWILWSALAGAAAALLLARLNGTP